MAHESRRWGRKVGRVAMVIATQRMVRRERLLRDCMRLLAVAAWLLLMPASSLAQFCTTLTSDDPSSVAVGNGAIFDTVKGANINPSTVQLVFGTSPNTVVGATPLDSTGISPTEVDVFL